MVEGAESVLTEFADFAKEWRDKIEDLIDLLRMAHEMLNSLPLLQETVVGVADKYLNLAGMGDALQGLLDNGLKELGNILDELGILDLGEAMLKFRFIFENIAELEGWVRRPASGCKGAVGTHTWLLGRLLVC